MVAQPTSSVMTVTEYLELERHSEIKYEYIDGHVYAMAGGTPDHSILGANVVAALIVALRQSPCRVYNPNVRVRLSETRYVYVDAAVSCDERDRGQTEEIHYPCLIVAVLSDATESKDRGDKLAYYRAGDTVQDYLLVNQHRAEIEHYHRLADGIWTYRGYGPGEEVPIERLDIRCAVDDIYAKVDL